MAIYCEFFHQIIINLLANKTGVRFFEKKFKVRMPHEFFSLNGVLNPPPSAAAPLDASSRLTRGSTGLRMIPNDNTDFVKMVPTKGEKEKSGKSILNKRININKSEFETSLTHTEPERVQPPNGPPPSNQWGVGASINKTPVLFDDSLNRFLQLNKKNLKRKKNVSKPPPRKRRVVRACR